MPTFKYKAISRDGAAVGGVIEAYDQYEAIDLIKETCSVVTGISEIKARQKEQKDLFAPAQISHKALALLCSQFAITLTAGLPVVRTVELIRRQTSDRQLNKLLGQVAEDVSAGYGLAQSFENKGGSLLPTTFIETMRSGEESGTLDISFGKLYRYYDKSAKVKAKVRSAMIYPVFLCILAVIVISVIMGFTMPTFVNMFASLGVEMPLLTRGLIAVANFFSDYWWLAALVLLVAAVAFKSYASTESGALHLARLQLRLPALGRVAQTKGASQLANTLSTLLAAGLPMIRAVTVASRVLDNRWMGMQLGSLVPGLEEGRRLGDCMQDCRCFPELLCEMAAVGEETGSLDETLETIGAYYDGEVEVVSNRALSMLQPAITVVMGIVIGLIVIALYLPMFSMYAGI